MNFSDQEIHEHLRHALITLHDLCNSLDNEIQLNASRSLAELMIEIHKVQSDVIDIDDEFLGELDDKADEASE